MRKVHLEVENRTKSLFPWRCNVINRRHLLGTADDQDNILIQKNVNFYSLVQSHLMNVGEQTISGTTMSCWFVMAPRDSCRGCMVFGALLALLGVVTSQGRSSIMIVNIDPL